MTAASISWRRAKSAALNAPCVARPSRIGTQLGCLDIGSLPVQLGMPNFPEGDFLLALHDAQFVRRSLGEMLFKGVDGHLEIIAPLGTPSGSAGSVRLQSGQGAPVPPHCMPFHRGRAVRRDFRRPATIIAPRTVPHHRIPNCLVGGLLTQRRFNCGEVVPSRVEGEGLSLILKTSIRCRMFPVLVQ